MQQPPAPWDEEWARHQASEAADRQPHQQQPLEGTPDPQDQEQQWAGGGTQPAYHPAQDAQQWAGGAQPAYPEQDAQWQHQAPPLTQPLEGTLDPQLQLAPPGMEWQPATQQGQQPAVDGGNLAPLMAGQGWQPQQWQQPTGALPDQEWQHQQPHSQQQQQQEQFFATPGGQVLEQEQAGKKKKRKRKGTEDSDDSSDEEDEDESEDGAEVGFRCKVARAIFGAAVLVVLTFSLFSHRWQHQTIKATPKDVYHLTSTLKGLAPGVKVDPVPDKESLSEKPVALFHLYAGLFYVSVESLCDPPGDVFDKFIDRQACRSRLELFCESLEEKMPDDSAMVEAVEKAYKSCKERMQKTDGISIPLLSGPDDDDVAMPRKTGESAVKSFEAEMDLDTGDYDVDFCDTVADCEKLQGLRSWSTTLVALVMSAIGVAVVAEALLVLHLFLPSWKAGPYGCPALLAVLPFLVTVIALYVYVDGQYPVEKLVRAEDLFYFILPPDIDVGFAGGEEAVRSAQHSEHGHTSSLLQLGDHSIEQQGRLRPWNDNHPHAQHHRHLDHRHHRRHRDHHDYAYLNSYSTVDRAPTTDHQQLTMSQEIQGRPTADLLEDGSNVVPSLDNLRWIPSTADEWEAEPISILPNCRFGRLGRRWNPRRRTSGMSVSELQHDVQAITHSRALGQETIPYARWQSTLVTLTGNLVNAVMTGDVTKLIELLAEAIGRAMRLCETILENWDGYLKAKIFSSQSAAGNVGQGLLSSVVNGFDKCDDMLLLALALCTGTTSSSSCQHPVKKLLAVSEAVSELKARAKDQVNGVVGLLKACLEALQGVMKVWAAIKDPAWNVIQHAKKTIGQMKDAGDNPVGMVMSAAQSLMDPKIMSDVQTLIAQLNTALPRIMMRFKTLAKHFVSFGKNMSSFFNDLRITMMDLGNLNLDKDKSLVGISASQHEASTFWTGKGSPGSALMEMSAGGPTWEVAMGPLAEGSLGNLAAKVGAVFLREIEHMESRKGLVSSKQWAKCEASEPSSCLHFGTAFVLLLVVSFCLLVGSAGFGCGCC